MVGGRAGQKALSQAHCYVFTSTSPPECPSGPTDFSLETMGSMLQPKGGTIVVETSGTGGDRILSRTDIFSPTW